MNRFIIGRLLSLSAGAVLMIGASAFSADARTNYALVVGVTKYPNLPENTWLVGPDNDARLVSDYLVGQAGFKPENVTVLADGIEGATTPTLGNIRGAMKALAERVKADGDEDSFVYLHFSGHGSQMPARSDDNENDGKDEIFLPADTKGWDRQLNGFPNAYVDDDIGADITALREAGAFVWAVFDACHSSSATRAAPGEGVEVSRRLDPTALGAPEDALLAATRAVGDGGQERENPVEDTDDGVEKGGLVAFFAAQTVETTPEMPLPRDAEEQTRYGLFTYTLFESIAKYPGISYRQLGQTVLQAYSGMNRRAPTPLFEGDLDGRVFGTEIDDPVVQWRIKPDGGKATIEAGQLHRLDKGTKLALLENAADTLEDAKGYLEVVSAKSLKSTLAPIAYEGKPALSEEELAKGGWVRPVELSIGFEMTVARPGPSAAEIDSALEHLAADESQLFRIRLVGPGEPADISLTVASEDDILARMSADAAAAYQSQVAATRGGASKEPRLWFLPSSGEASLLPGRRAPSMTLSGGGDKPGELEKQLAGRLTKIFRATNLARMTEASDFRGKVELSFLILRDGAGDFEPIEAGKIPFVSDGDEIHVRVTNNASGAIDLNVLHIGTDYAISAVDPMRIERKGEEEIGLFAVNTETLGVERLVAVVTEALPGTDVQDLRFLAQGGMRSAETAKGTGEEGGLMAMINAMGRSASTRAATSLSAKKGAKGAVMIFPVETVARN
ncbi:MAG: caspase family protein [Rhizobiaceae bacterium]